MRMRWQIPSGIAIAMGFGSSCGPDRLRPLSLSKELRKRDSAQIFLHLVHSKPETAETTPGANGDRRVRDQMTWPTRMPMPYVTAIATLPPITLRQNGLV